MKLQAKNFTDFLFYHERFGIKSYKPSTQDQGNLIGAGREGSRFVFFKSVNISNRKMFNVSFRKLGASVFTRNKSFEEF